MATANLPTQRFGGLRAWLMAFFYDRFLAQPEAHGLGDWRRMLIQPLTGVVVEIGAGTGVNLPNYGDVAELLLTEPDPHMRSQLVTKLQARPELVATVSDAPAERLPCGDHSVDAVVCTLVLCSVLDPAVVLAEVRRVLKPGGRLIFLEHVGSDDPAVLRWQGQVETVWKHCAGNCHLTRQTEASMVAAGFELDEIIHANMPKSAQFLRVTIRGIARSPSS
ncbi:MAG: methyltransferase domain-containing protein [Rhodobacterales bacterium]|nr:methyltransferase domain-containing protein [Rhodobacterales bacterium]